VVAAGPLSSDLYDPAAPAWALATGLASRGHSVRVLFPGTSGTPAPPGGLEVSAFPPVTAHVGSALGDAELSRSAGRHLRPEAEVVVRDPSGLGSLGHHVGKRSVVSFVRALEGDPPSGGSAGAALAGLRSRLLGWGGYHGVRRLEREALEDATAICCATVAHRDRVKSEYKIAAERLRVVPPAVAPGPTAPAREAARRRIGVPDDVLVAVALPPVDPADTTSVAPAVDAIRRARPIFSGARLAVLGLPADNSPGLVALPSRDAESVTAAVAAADVAIACDPGSGFDPGVVVALRLGTATIVGPTFDLGNGSDGSVRRADTKDPAELASVLAELFADPEERHALSEKARLFVRRHEPERLAQELESAGALDAT